MPHTVRPADTIAILSGASRGLGLAMAQALAASTHVRLLITVSRSPCAELDTTARDAGLTLHQLTADLADASQANRAAHDIARLLPDDAARYLLINNAGTVAPMCATDGLDDAEAIAGALQLNVGSVMLLTTAFLRATQGLPADRRILNVSSGAGRRAVPGWGVYCATKAALDTYTQVVQLEHPGLRIAAMAPGVVDTAMQASIRTSDPAHFPQRAQFIDLHEQGLLSSPGDTARRMLNRLLQDDFGTPVLDDIRLHTVS